MSLTLKLASLLIRTLAKPVGNRIKSRAREHETFRAAFVRFSQGLHRVDMRMRLGILHDAAAQERMHAREAAEAAKKKEESEKPIVRTESQQKVYDAEQAEEEARQKGKKEQKPPSPRIRPLSEAKAIDLGANFASEAFIFMVAAGLLVFERWWSRRKENQKDEHVVERLTALEEQTETISYLQAEIERLRSEAKARDDREMEKSAGLEKKKKKTTSEDQQRRKSSE